MHGLYINLDRSVARRARLEAELQRFGLKDSYRRIRGILDERPLIGCSTSHIKAITEARRIGGIVHIIEDDVLLSDRVAPFLSSPRAVELLATYDILFLSMWVDPDPVSVHSYRSKLAAAGAAGDVLDLRGYRIGAMDSYVVAPRSIDRIIGLMSARVVRQPTMMNDAFIGEQVKAGVLTAAVVVPFLTCIDIDTGTRSAIQALSREEQTRFVRLRTSFFVDHDRQPSFDLGGPPSVP